MDKKALLEQKTKLEKELNELRESIERRRSGLVVSGTNVIDTKVEEVRFETKNRMKEMLDAILANPVE